MGLGAGGGEGGGVLHRDIRRVKLVDTFDDCERSVARASSVYVDGGLTVVHAEMYYYYSCDNRKISVNCVTRYENNLSSNRAAASCRSSFI